MSGVVGEVAKRGSRYSPTHEKDGEDDADPVKFDSLSSFLEEHASLLRGSHDVSARSLHLAALDEVGGFGEDDSDSGGEEGNTVGNC